MRGECHVLKLGFHTVPHWLNPVLLQSPTRPAVLTALQAFSIACTTFDSKMLL